jgi:hypothetical protein
MQDFRTRVVCPDCGGADNSELAGPRSFDALPLLSQSVVRRCLDCHYLWWVDWSPRPTMAVH